MSRPIQDSANIVVLYVSSSSSSSLCVMEIDEFEKSAEIESVHAENRVFAAKSLVCKEQAGVETVI